MEPLLPRLCKLGLPFVSDAPVAVEATDALRRKVRLVWTSATRVGAVGYAWRAAAAAAADNKEGLDSRRGKTAAAAVVALGSTVVEAKGC